MGSIRQKAGKTIYGWAWEGDTDAIQTKSNWMQMEWPHHSDHWLHFPEVDRCAWFDSETAKRRINPAQVAFITTLETVIANN